MSISVAPGSLPPCRRIHQVSGGPGETGAAYPVTGLGLWGFGALGFGAWGTARDRYESELGGGDGAGLGGRRAAFACRAGTVAVPAGPAAVLPVPAATAAIAAAGGLHVAVPGSATAVHVPGSAAAVGLSIGDDAGRPADGRPPDGRAATTTIGDLRELPEIARRGQGKGRSGLRDRQTQGRSQRHVCGGAKLHGRRGQ